MLKKPMMGTMEPLMDQEIIGKNIERYPRYVELEETRGLIPTITDKPFVTPRSDGISGSILLARERPTKVFLLS